MLKPQIVSGLQYLIRSQSLTFHTVRGVPFYPVYLIKWNCLIYFFSSVGIFIPLLDFETCQRISDSKNFRVYYQILETYRVYVLLGRGWRSVEVSEGGPRTLLPVPFVTCQSPSLPVQDQPPTSSVWTSSGRYGLTVWTITKFSLLPMVTLSLSFMKTGGKIFHSRETPLQYNTILFFIYEPETEVKDRVLRILRKLKVSLPQGPRKKQDYKNQKLGPRTVSRGLKNLKTITIIKEFMYQTDRKDL